MAGAFLKYDIKTEGLKEWQEYLASQEYRAVNRKPLMLKIGIKMMGAVLKNFSTQGARVGGWKPLSPVTIARRRKGGGSGSAKILMDTGALRGSLSMRATESQAIVGTNKIYAAAMNFGLPARTGNVKSFSRRRPVSGGTTTVKAHTIRLPKVPARPFLALNNEDINGIQNLLGDYLTLQEKKE